MKPRVLVVDNYDSFTFNLAQLLASLGAAPLVLRNDAIDVGALEREPPDAVVLSPGPGHPSDPARTGACSLVIERLALARRVPLLGVCLGHQTIATTLGGRVVRAPVPMHGKASAVAHEGDALFAGLPSPFVAMRYHSLVVDEATLPACLAVTARGPAGEVMALRHRDVPMVGVQFHPESIGTPDGPAIVASFLPACR